MGDMKYGLDYYDSKVVFPDKTELKARLRVVLLKRPEGDTTSLCLSDLESKTLFQQREFFFSKIFMGLVPGTHIKFPDGSTCDESNINTWLNFVHVQAALYKGYTNTILEPEGATFFPI